MKYSQQNEIISNKVTRLSVQRYKQIDMSEGDLSDKLRTFLIENATSPQYHSLLKQSEAILHHHLDKQNMFEERTHQDLSAAEITKITNIRFTEGFKVIQQLKDPELAMKNLGYTLQIGGLYLNAGAFLVTIQFVGDEEQVKFWQNQVNKGRCIGCYAQTELGHGSNVQMLEAEAHYNDKTQTFLINSSTSTSYKFWPGALGNSSTHCVFQAKTFVKGKSIGVQTFVFKIRNEKLEALEGVDVGDIGPKLGFIRVDNGFLQLRNFEAPRNSMLSRFVKISAEGNVSGLENSQAIKYAYGSMLNLRVVLVYTFSNLFIMQPAIQLYTIFKQMGTLQEQTNIKVIVENMSIGYGLFLSNTYANSILKQYLTELKQENFKAADKLLQQCHLTSSIFKALSSWAAVRCSKNIMISSKIGIFKSSFLPKLFTDSVPSVTYEGDNTVLTQQITKFLFSQTKHTNIKEIKYTMLKTDNFEGIIEILQIIVLTQLSKLKQRFALQSVKSSLNVMWNEKFQVQIVEIAKLWGRWNLVKGFHHSLSNLPHQDMKSLFLKLGQVYCKYLLDETPQLEFYGITIQDHHSWKNITLQELQTIIHVKKIIPRPLEEMKFIPSLQNWIHAKL